MDGLIEAMKAASRDLWAGRDPRVAVELVELRWMMPNGYDFEWEWSDEFHEVVRVYTNGVGLASLAVKAVDGIRWLEFDDGWVKVVCR